MIWINRLTSKNYFGYKKYLNRLGQCYQNIWSDDSNKNKKITFEEALVHNIKSQIQSGIFPLLLRILVLQMSQGSILHICNLYIVIVKLAKPSFHIVKHLFRNNLFKGKTIRFLLCQNMNFWSESFYILTYF